MYPRTVYEMTEEDLKNLLNASKPTPCMMVGSYIVPTPQENANRAWQALGEKMGFDYMTVRPIEGKNQRFFTAVPLETKSQKEARLKQEAKTKREAEIAKLESEVTKLTSQLKKLKEEDNNAN